MLQYVPTPQLPRNNFGRQVQGNHENIWSRFLHGKVALHYTTCSSWLPYRLQLAIDLAIDIVVDYLTDCNDQSTWQSTTPLIATSIDMAISFGIDCWMKSTWQSTTISTTWWSQHESRLPYQLLDEVSMLVRYSINWLQIVVDAEVNLDMTTTKSRQQGNSLPHPLLDEVDNPVECKLAVDVAID